VSDAEVARRVAALYPTRFLRSYVRWKIANDAVYDAVYRRAQGPIVDIGCGAGVLAAYLRARGCDAPIAGVDHDARKIEVARALGLRDATFKVATPPRSRLAAPSSCSICFTTLTTTRKRRYSAAPRSRAWSSSETVSATAAGAIAQPTRRRRSRARCGG